MTNLYTEEMDTQANPFNKCGALSAGTPANKMAKLLLKQLYVSSKSVQIGKLHLHC